MSLIQLVGLQEEQMPDTAMPNCAKTLSAVFIFGGDIMPADNPGYLGGLGYRSLQKLERDKTGPMPSYERVLAGAALYKMNPKLTLIPSAGRSNLPEATADAPSIARVMATELRYLGVPAHSIIEEPASFETQEHFINCSAIARERGWHAAEIGILTLFWHFGRIATMMMRIQAGNSIRIEPLALGETRFISVERVLASVDEEKWKKYFTELYDHREMIELPDVSAARFSIVQCFGNLYPGS
jgi:hypothetical protein